MSQESPDISTNSKSKIGKYVAISIVFGIIVICILFAYGDFAQVVQSFAKFRWEFVPLILLLTLINYYLRFVKWDYYLRYLDIKIPKKVSLSIFLSGLTMSVTPGKLGEVFKSYLLFDYNKTAVSRSIPVVLAERVTDVMGLLILSAIAFPVFKYGTVVLIIILVVLILLILIIKIRSFCYKIIRLCEFIPFAKKYSKSLYTLYETSYTLFKMKPLILSTVLSVISWGFECVAMDFVLLGFKQNTSALLGIFVFSFSSLAGAVSMIPGGLIVAESGSIALLVMANISRSIAVSATIIIRFCTLWFGVAIGVITLLFSRNKPNIDTNNTVNKI
jgi:uncharacterized protein (TIRG00374 family)